MTAYNGRCADAGASINIKSEKGKKALDYAKQSGNGMVIDMLRAAGK